jgi:hypothetical protein
VGIAVDLDVCCAPSEELLISDMAGELIIAPLAAEPGDMEDGFYALNATGRAVWERLDGRTSLRDIAQALAERYQAPIGGVERDVVALVTELFDRHILVASCEEAVRR